MPGGNELTLEWFNETTASFRNPLPEPDDQDLDACVPDSAGEEEESDLDLPKAIQPKAADPSSAYRAASSAFPGKIRTGLITPRAGLVAGPSRTPLNAVASGSRGVQAGHQPESPASQASYFSVCWRKPQFKKSVDLAHSSNDRLYSYVQPLIEASETWDGDAFIMIVRNRVTLISEETGDAMGTSALPEGHMPGAGSELRVGNYDVEVQDSVTYEVFKKSTCILNRPSGGKGSSSGYTPTSYSKPFKAPAQVKPARKMPGFTPARPISGNAETSKPRTSDSAPRSLSAARPESPATTMKGVSAASFYSAPKTTTERIIIGEKSNKQRLAWGGAMHDPTAEGAVVMQRPPEAVAKKKNTEIVDVVIDPLLSCRMRDHQKTGVQFMYSSVMGLTDVEAEGCILADEMGLGKTLQTIALIYTMIRQSPFKNDPAGVIGKALIVCPVSLVENWRKEFRKWIGDKLVTVTVTDANITKIKSFTHNKAQHVLIIGYERLRKVIKDLAACVPPIGLVVCDEGHRLKSKDNKTSRMFEALRTTRRIILTGTPLQNDLSEFWAMVDFVCPGLLSDYKKFQKYYERKIYEGRAKNASSKQVAEGRQRGEELGELSRKFILKRTAAVLNNYLPPKFEYVLFVSPSLLQIKILQGISRETHFRANGTDSLGMIDLFRKISNSPLLLKSKADDTDSPFNAGSVLESAKNEGRGLIPIGTMNTDTSVSGKLTLMMRLLDRFHSFGREKVVIVSNWTGTLDIIGEILKNKRYPFHRLDGSTPSKDRQRLVDSFNRESRDQSFVFLLSSKAGGVGINLIGASRLILFDSDWNPATDAQAMARIHRDGQKMPVYIYRLLTTNSIDEKIYQRQISKIGLANQMMDQRGPGDRDGNKGNAFSDEELKALFRFFASTDGCKTHDLIQCDCQTKDPALFSGESSTREPTPAESESDEEEPCAKFVTASQYDPKPSRTEQRQKAAEQKRALDALKSWRHFDGLDKTRFEPIADQNLYDILLDDWNERGVEAYHRDDSAGLDDPLANGNAGGDTSNTGRVSKRARAGGPPKHQEALAALFDSSPTKSSDAGSSANDEDLFAPEPISPQAGSKRRLPVASSRTIAGLIDPDDKGKYDLLKIAEKGGPGRVTFIFEKQSASKMMADDEEAGEEAAA